MPKVGSNCICLATILNDFVFKKDKNYCPQVFLKECKYTGKEKRGLDILIITWKFLPMILMNKFLIKNRLIYKSL